MNLIFFGSPGVGKGTQAKILSAKLSIPHISTGDILREAVTNETELGLKAKKVMNSGELVSDEIMIGIIREVLNDKKCEKGFILDGFPRSINQAIELEKLFDDLLLKNVIVINISANEEEIVKRLTNRRACKNCGVIFNYNSIKDLNKCPKCSTQNSFFHRKDDQEEVIRKRLEIFKTTTEPVLSYYSGSGKVININGKAQVEEVTEDILNSLKERFGEKITLSA